MRKEKLTTILIISMLLGTYLISITPMAKAATSLQLVAFGVKLGSGTPPPITDIGWARGNSDKGWLEGTWIPCKLVITNVQDDHPNLAGFPDVYIEYSFTGGGSNKPRFIDLVRDIQIGTADLADSQGWPKLDGTEYPQTTLAEVREAQTSPDGGTWPGFVDADTLTDWDPSDQINILPDDSVTSSTLQFWLTSAQIAEAVVDSTTDTIVIYFQFHLSRTFVWNNGLQEQYATNDPAMYQGGTRYGISPYDEDIRLGSGFVPGSSGHMYVNMDGYGKITAQLPVPETPTGEVSGYKWEDDNSNGVMDGAEEYTWLGYPRFR
jgi:hypothetical protein